ncbi:MULTISPECIES: class I SAM-dependent methyltransferase [Janibacter]|uniref:Class I SAM-dependent methyltransferase n=1 Tax=Janibacter melonis TaxID=262209 RepID=A0A650GEJ9_9MICO|nr:class I SAM-dependent methyltransferase [Janibacter melonis]QGX08727.1 class I SAM-dependent methyltransferase [Janibacter melonis]
MDVTTVKALAGPQGHELLSSLPPYDESQVLAVQGRLRAQGHSPELVAAALTQHRLRHRARDKFGEFADGMLFTPDGLEQATRLEVAATHAARFAAASLATVHDLGCGIGSDAMAMSSLGVTVQGLDRDPVTAAVADSNLRPWPDSRARVGLAEDLQPPADPIHARVGIWLDPARRTPGVADAQGRTRRVFRLEELSPSWDLVLELATAVPATGVKMSPSLPHDVPPLGTEAQWVSYDGTVLECSVWWGPLVRTAGRSALVMRHGAPSVRVDQSHADEDPPAVASLGGLGAHLYEADRAVVRAGLVGALTREVGGAEVEPGLGLVTSESAHDVPFARGYRVVEAMPYNVKVLRAWLRERGITGLTIKKRGIRVDDEQLRRGLRIGRGAGDGAQAVVVLTRVAGESAAVVVEPLA